MFGIQGLGFGFRVWDLVFGFWVFGFRGLVSGFGFRGAVLLPSLGRFGMGRRHKGRASGREGEIHGGIR